MALLLSLDSVTEPSLDAGTANPLTCRRPDDIFGARSLPSVDRCFVVVTRARLEATLSTLFGCLGWAVSLKTVFDFNGVHNEDDDAVFDVDFFPVCGTITGLGSTVGINEEVVAAAAG